MKLTRHQTRANSIARYADDGILINGTTYSDSLIVSAERIVSPWAHGDVAELTEAILAPALEQAPATLIVGCGRAQAFLPPELLTVLARSGTGVEVMTTDAACRTYNVLVSEHRDVVAALMLRQ